MTRSAGGSLCNKPEEEVLTLVRHLAVREENVMVARTTLHDMKQDGDETIRSFGARIKGQANVCKFATPCPSCGAKVNYTEEVMRDVLARGIVDPDIQLDLLGDSKQDMTLEQMFRLHPIPVPIHWRDPVKAGLDQDVRLGVIEPVPVGEPVTWCHQMVICPKKNGEPRRTVDLQPLNVHATRETHHIPSSFHQARSVPRGTDLGIIPARRRLYWMRGTGITAYPFGRKTVTSRPSSPLGADTGTGPPHKDTSPRVTATPDGMTNW